MNPSVAAPPKSGVSIELAELVEKLTARIKAGESPDLDAIVGDHPDYADELRRLLPAMKLLADLSRNGSLPSIADGEIPLGDLGDFRLIREVGRGGMGVVYEAEQLSLRRRVALKVLPFAATMDPRHLQRFKNEALAAASLEHPNIVPVYGVGCERGVHFYAMKFIEGQTLAQLIQGLRSPAEPIQALSDETAAYPVIAGSAPTAPIAGLSTKPGLRGKTHFRRIAELIAQAADALEHAHSMGIVHRDVKPGNLLLDSAGKVYVSDFGLARFGDDASMTMSGDLIGTLRYMSPEQALARHGLVDHRTDIYSLGATLYELLTLNPAVPGVDKAEILKSIAWEEPIPLRKHDKSIPAELETITLKCLAKNPTERYGSAGEVAEDLRRWLGDRAIQAKPPGWREKAAKWGRRHRGLVAASIAMILVVAGALGVSSFLVWRKSEQVQLAYGTAKRERDSALERLAFARDIAGEMYSEVTDKLLRVDSGMDEVQQQFLRKSLAFFQKFAQSDESGPAGIRDRATAYCRIGVTYSKLRQHEEAAAALQQSIILYRELLAECPDKESDRAGLALALHSMATNRKRGSTGDASLREAIELRRGLVKDFDNNDNYRRDLAISLNVLALEHFNARRFPEAEQLHRQVIAEQRRFDDEDSDASDRRHHLAGSLHNLALACNAQGKRDEARELFREAIALELSVVEEKPLVRSPRESLCYQYSQLSLLLWNEGNKEGAEKAIRECSAHWERLVNYFPRTGLYREKLLDTQRRHGMALTALKKYSEAETILRQAIASFEQARRRSNSGASGVDLALARSALAEVYRETDRLDEASDMLLEAVENLGGAVPNSPNARYLGGILSDLGMVSSWKGDTARAIELTKQAIIYQRQAFSSAPENSQNRRHLCIQLLNLAEYLTDSSSDPKDTELAIQSAQEAVNLNPKAPHSHGHLGRSLVRARRYAEAISELEAATNGTDTPEHHVDWWLHLAIAHRELGDAAQSLLYLAAADQRMARGSFKRHDRQRLGRVRNEVVDLLGVRSSPLAENGLRREGK